MLSKELRKKFLDFFRKQGHTIVPSSSLIPADPSVLFTTAGMQQFKPYYLGEKSSHGLNVTSCQKCFRTSDIEEVGDEKHLTFLEMLGNFSFGGYFKEEAIKFAHQFLFKELKLKTDNFFFTVFEGDEGVPFDKESFLIWKKLGIPENKIKKSGKEDNFWGPTGEEGPCGPTTEIYFAPHHFWNKSGEGVELWNLVFNEYYQDKKRSLAPLKQKGVDTGMGLERLAMIIQGKSSVYETDLFLPIIQEINSTPPPKPNELYIQHRGRGKIQNLERIKRIISDHTKSAVFLISEGIFPSNVERGYVLRRVLRRAIRYGKLLTQPSGALRAGLIIPLAQKVVEIYKEVYPEVKSKETDILTIIQNEEEKFEKTLQEGLKQFEKMATFAVSADLELPGEKVFDLYQNYGFPMELTEELAKEKKLNIDKKGFEEAFKKHQEISRAGAGKKFGGVGKEATYEATKLHTATHLLHAALREILGKHIKQMGSDITPQRLRFDFLHPQKMTSEEIKKVEDLVNQKIKENLEVKKEEMTYKKAIEQGALAFFKEKYPPIVTVYSINNWSKEICAGPHVSRTFELGRFKIIKEESSGAGVRRIRAILE